MMLKHAMTDIDVEDVQVAIYIRYHFNGILVAHTERALQHLTSCFPHPTSILIGDKELKTVHQFTYLGSVISSEVDRSGQFPARSQEGVLAGESLEAALSCVYCTMPSPLFS